MSAETDAIAASLVVLTLLLAVLSIRGIVRYVRSRLWTQLMWAGGLALATAAMAVEAIVYVGVVDELLLQAYVFFSAAIVGVLSLGATKVLRRPVVERVYTVYTWAATLVVAVFSFLTPVSTSIVVGGIISGNPPLLLLILSSFVTGPATIVLLTASVVALRRSWRWPTLLMVAGALILGAGGTLYIASFPVALYYAEFVGIIVLFLGLVTLPQTAPAGTSAPAG
ncbi:MAG TPA: hypothetical protein VFG07_10765 [Thermoplasmata archaeon]|nr:hypothetical protein [Thermoplasmata archaeon]